MPSNRIEVDLKLLQDTNLQKLTEFGKQFSKTVDSLGMILGNFSSQISGASIASGTTDSASRSTNVRMPTSGVAKMAGSSADLEDSGGYPFANASGTSYGSSGGSSDSRQVDQQFGGGGAFYGGDSGSPFETQYVRATRRIGQIPVGLRQLFGYAAEGALPWQKAPFTTNAAGEQVPVTDNRGRQVPAGMTLDENGNAVPGRLMNVGSQVSDFLFTTQAIGQNLSLMNQHMSDARSMVIGNALYGQNLGYSRAGGLFGTPIGSPAFNVSLSNTFEAMRAANFGLDLSYSPEQAKQAMQAITGYGWSGDNTTSWMLNFLKHQQNQGITPDTAMALLDPYLRFGGTEDLTQLHNILNSIGPAAKAANMNLTQFQEQLVSTAQGIAQTTGQTVGSAAAALTAFSSVTGLAPERAAGLFENGQNYFRAAAMTGQSIWQVASGQNSMQAMQAFSALQFSQAVGGLTPQQIQQGLKAQKNSSQYQMINQVMSRAEAMYLMNPQIFGGMSPREWLNQGLRAGSWKGIGQRESVMQSLSSLNPSQDINFKNLIQKYAAGNPKYAYSIETGMSKDFSTWLEGAGKQYAGNSETDLKMQREHKLKYLLDQLTTQNQKHARQAQKQVTIGLSRTAEKLFTLMNNEYGRNSKSSSNRWTEIDSYTRKAMHFAEDAGHLIGMIP